MNEAKYFILIGPAGVGKGTMVSMLLARHPEFVPTLSATTRPPRPEEMSGVVHVFVSEEEFDGYIAEGKLLEHQLIHRKYRYGILKGPVLDALNAGKNVLGEVEVQGWETMKANPEIAPYMRVIFMMPPSIEAIAERVRRRAPTTEEEVQRRMETARWELTFADGADFQVLAEENQQEKIYEQIENYILGKIGR